MQASSPIPALARCGLVALLAAAPPAQVDAHAYTQDERIRLVRGSWLAPEHVERLEVGGASDGMEAWAGKQAWPLVQDPHKPVHVLVVDDRLRQAWRAAGTLVVGYPTQRDSGGELTLRASPRRLTLPADGVRFTLVQRSRTAVEGTDGFLRVAIDDITDGQTLLTVTGADRRAFVERRSVRQGEHVELDLGDGRYVLVAQQLRNLLIGDDYATFVLLPAEVFVADRIARLLQRIAAADVTFVREGKGYPGPDAAAHLRQKYQAARDRVATVEDFVVHIGSRSSLTGDPYSIRHPDGSTQSAETWLRAQVAALERGDEAAAKAGAGSADRR